MHQEFRGNVGQVVNGDLITYGYGHGKAPTPESHAARVCPQCRELTWQYTQHCIHCNLNLFEWDQRRQAWTQRQAIRKQANWLLVGGFVLLGTSWLLDRLDIWQAGQLVTFVSGLVLLAFAGKLLNS